MKPENRKVLNARAEAALRDMYHNASIAYPRDLCGRSSEYFEQWFADVCEQELDYLRSGGAYGSNYRKTLAAPCNAGKYKSLAAQRRYIDKGLRAMAEERADCGAMTGWKRLERAAFIAGPAQRALWETIKARSIDPLTARNDSLWERATEYGEITQYGRGGRSLAPADFLRHTGGGGYYILIDAGAEMGPGACTELIQIIESFNRYIGQRCAGVPELWAEHCREEDAADLAAKRAKAARKGKETRERNYWAARDTITV